MLQRHLTNSLFSCIRGTFHLSLTYRHIGGLHQKVGCCGSPQLKGKRPVWADSDARGDGGALGLKSEFLIPFVCQQGEVEVGVICSLQ